MEALPSHLTRVDVFVEKLLTGLEMVYIRLELLTYKHSVNIQLSTSTGT